MYKVRVEKRGTRYWVVIRESLSEGTTEIFDGFITKRSALKYIAERKLVS